MARAMIAQAVKNQVQFGYVLFDAWFSSVENLKFIKEDCQKDVICPIKTNRYIALSFEGKQAGLWTAVSTLEIEADSVLEIWLEGVEFPLLLAQQIFTNEDGTSSILHLISSDRTLLKNQLTTIYQRRWNVEVYHKSLKQNVSLSKSPTQTETTQTNHFFRRLVRLHKTGNAEGRNQNQSFCLENEIICQCSTISFSNFARIAPCQILRVRWVLTVFLLLLGCYPFNIF
jgi:Transposase DDE domain